MMGHFHMKVFHISSANNCVAYALSRGQFQKFKELAPEADTFPTAVPMEFWSLLNSTLYRIAYLWQNSNYINKYFDSYWPSDVSTLICFRHTLYLSIFI
jgi:hypothetical protein